MLGRQKKISFNGATRMQRFQRLFRLLGLVVILLPFLQVFISPINTSEADVTTDQYHYSDGRPADNYAWQPNGSNQNDVMNPLGGYDGVQSSDSDNVTKLSPDDSKTQMAFGDGSTSYNAQTNPAYTISKYATQTGQGQYNVTLNVKGNSTEIKTPTPLDIVFVVDMSGSMELKDDDSQDLDYQYYYTGRDRNWNMAKYVRSSRLDSQNDYFSSDTVKNSSEKYEQYVDLSELSNAYSLSAYYDAFRFREPDKNDSSQTQAWYKFDTQGNFKKVNGMSDRVPNPDYSRSSGNTRAENVRAGLNSALSIIQSNTDKGVIQGQVSVGLVGFSDANSITNDTEVNLNEFDAKQVTAMNDAIAPDFSGGTWTQNGLERGAKMLNAAPSDAKKILILLTDGQPTESGEPGDLNGDGTDTNDSIWRDTINAARTIEQGDSNTSGVHIQGIGIDTRDEDQSNFEQLTSKKTDGSRDYVAVNNGDAIAKALTDDVSFDLKTTMSPGTISGGIIDDPLGDQYSYSTNQSPKVTSSGSAAVADSQISNIQQQLKTQVQSGNRKLHLTGLNLAKDQQVTITYPVQMNTEDDNWKPDTWYPMNGNTTLTPAQNVPPVNFGVPSGRESGVSVTAQKIWHDTDTSKRPKSVKFTVKRSVNGKEDANWEATGELTKDNNWTGTFNHLTHNNQEVALPQYNNEGQQFTYTVTDETQTDDLKAGGYGLANVQDGKLTNQQYLLNVKKLASGSEFSANALANAEFTVEDSQGQSQSISDKEPYAYLYPGEHYTAWETAPPKGYKLDGTKYTVTLTKDGQFQASSSQDQLTKLPASGIAKDGFYITDDGDNGKAKVVTLVKTDEPKVPPTTLTINKTDDSSPGKPLPGADFTVSGTVVKQENNGASFTTPQLSLDHTYDVTETKSPDGYAGLQQSITVEVENDGGVTLALGPTGKPVTVPTDGTTVDLAPDVKAQIVMTGTNDAPTRQIVLTIANHKKGILPHTGSGGPLRALMLSAALTLTAVLLFGVAWLQKREEEA